MAKINRPLSRNLLIASTALTLVGLGTPTLVYAQACVDGANAASCTIDGSLGGADTPTLGAGVIATVNDGVTIDEAIKGSAANQGTINFLGGATINGVIGATDPILSFIFNSGSGNTINANANITTKGLTIGGSGNVFIFGNGADTLTIGANNATVGTGSTLRVGNASAIITGNTITNTSGTIDFATAGTIASNVTLAGTGVIDFNAGGTLSGAVTLVSGTQIIIDASGVTLSGAVQGGGSLDINAAFSTGNVIGSTTALSAITVDGGTFSVGHNVGTDALTIGATGDLTVTAGTVTVGTGTGNVTLGGAGVVVTLSGATSALDVGTLDLAGGTLTLSNADALLGGNVALNGGTINLSAANTDTTKGVVGNITGSTGTVNVDANYKTAGTVAGAALNIDDNKTFTANNNITSTLITLGDVGTTDATFVVNAAGLTVGKIVGFADGDGVVQVSQAFTNTDVLGTSANSLANLKIDASTVLTVGANIDATAITLSGASSEINFTTASTGYTGAIVAGSGGEGIVDIDITMATGGDIGASGTRVDLVEQAASTVLTVGHNIFSDTITNLGTMNVATGLTLQGLTTLTNSGTISLADNSTISGGLTGAGTYTIAAGASGVNHTGAAGNFTDAELRLTATTNDVGYLNSTQNLTFDIAGADATALVVVDSGQLANGQYKVVTSTGGTDLTTITNAMITGSLGATSWYDYTVGSSTTATNLFVLKGDKSASSLGVGATSNEALAIAALLDLGRDSSAANTVIVAQTGAARATLLEQAGANITGNNVAAYTANNLVQGTVETRLADVRDYTNGISGLPAGDMKRGRGVWAMAFGQTADQDARNSIDGFDSNTYGTAVGADYRFRDNYIIGVALSYALSDVDGKDAGDTQTDVDSYQGTIYGSYNPSSGKWYADWAVAYALNQYETDNTIAGGKRNGDFDGNQYTARIGGGYHLGTGRVRVTPNASLQYTLLDLDSYRETGSTAFNRQVNQDDVAALDGRLGVDISVPRTYRNMEIIPALKLAVTHDFLGEEAETTSTFVGTSTPIAFTTKGQEVAETGYIVGLGLDVLGQKGWSVKANYDFEGREDYTSHAGFLKLRKEF